MSQAIKLQELDKALQDYVNCAIATERKRCINIIEHYQIPVGNSAAD